MIASSKTNQSIDQFANLHYSLLDNATTVEVYPRPDGTIYICGIGGSDYITKEELKEGAFREVIEANESRVKAASDSFRELSTVYKKKGELDKTQACMRPCPPDALPYMGVIPSYSNAYINAGHNCWGIAWRNWSWRAMPRA
jgi:glycine/D-amino acid oxidase-like deaminating enzyme